jgi:hypothetical protein
VKSLPDQGVRFEGGSLHTDLSHSALTPQSHKRLIETLKRHERATRARHSARRCYAGKSSEGARLWDRASASISERKVLSEKNRSIRFSSSANRSPGSDQAKKEKPEDDGEDDDEDDGDDDGIGDDDGTGEALAEYVSARTGLRQIMLDNS